MFIAIIFSVEEKDKCNECTSMYII